eukprot:TRINITY_DN589_c0_g1_i1.p1 TRINITY_DN589_c0_g1~~TRINITY_DN589_c0_g1_i1.p1  ORF type:complete len:649 (+),score=192.75 TRINITY_DN589_c0_g1_i1:76-2022(+)
MSYSQLLQDVLDRKLAQGTPSASPGAMPDTPRAPAKRPAEGSAGSAGEMKRCRSAASDAVAPAAPPSFSGNGGTGVCGTFSTTAGSSAPCRAGRRGGGGNNKNVNLFGQPRASRFPQGRARPGLPRPPPAGRQGPPLVPPGQQRLPFVPVQKRLSQPTLSDTMKRLGGSSKPDAGKTAMMGFNNLGNTCYMNAVLSSLVHQTDLADALCSTGRLYDLAGRREGLLPALRDIVGAARYGNLRRDNTSGLDAGALKRMLGQHHARFKGNSQQDAHEFLLKLLDHLHDEITDTYVGKVQPAPPAAAAAADAAAPSASSPPPTPPGAPSQPDGAGASPSGAAAARQDAPASQPTPAGGKRDEVDLTGCSDEESAPACSAAAPEAAAPEKELSEAEKLNALPPNESPSLVRRLFEGGVRKSMDCPQRCTEGASAVEESFNVLSLMLPSRKGGDTIDLEAEDAELSIPTLLAGFLSDEQVDRDCDECKAVRGTISERLCRLPHLLLLHVKRFDARITDAGAVRVDRRDDAVSVPHELCLDRFCTEDAELPPETATSFADSGEVRGRRPLRKAPPKDTGAHDSERHRYRLRSVVLHFGRTVRSGHYVCVFRSDDGTWWCANDEHIRKEPGTAEQVLSQQKVLQNGYLFCYERCGE